MLVRRRAGALPVKMAARDGEQIGWALRSKVRCNALFVSPGHRVSMQGALDAVLRTLRGYRLPEPTRLADRLASRRD